MIKATAVLITTKDKYPEGLVNFEDFEEVIVVPNCPNIYGRYVAALKARNDIVYFQDDDCIVDYKKLFESYDGRLTNTMTERHFEWYKQKGGITLVGWGCFFPKKMLMSFGKYVDKYGVDAHLLREGDRIFTYLNQPHNTLIMPHQDMAQDNRMSTTDPNHYLYIDQVLEKLRLL